MVDQQWRAIGKKERLKRKQEEIFKLKIENQTLRAENTQLKQQMQSERARPKMTFFPDAAVSSLIISGIIGVLYCK